jgi:hypothetical protein
MAAVNRTQTLALGLVGLFILAAPAGSSPDAGTPTPPGAASKPPAAAAKPARENLAEVEITGTLKLPANKPAKLIAFVSKRGCNPKQIEGALGSVNIDPNVATNFFIEIFVPQGSKGSVCGAGLDNDGNVVAFGAYSKNPLTFQGKGEVEFSNVVFSLKPLKAPVPGPKK